eukprot:CAMPEP_0201501516 /NCGR_PEP_ID=MMETSP0151_2-20130828/83629_1 /ASSEMBLY_ACC=CAM_ASM_000257 /TAXON_ID=200890 /ORGANISM="Paramoeba atlantica, Strain 621/1 / CCAP 1560/9" /LENGTH=326 /DNA_ID=CAMNT_0047895023 /DNA_START=79 /DNA_END=1059 /DNA_ORIENTATION=+
MASKSFTSLLQGEISRKRKANSDTGPASKYVKKGDLMKQKKEEEEAKKKAKLAEERRRLALEEEEEKKRLEAQRQEKLQTLTWEEEKLLEIPVEEVKKRLRAMKEPITFFGESDLERARRLHALEKGRETDMDKGQRHDLGKILASLEERGEGDKVPQKEEVVWAELIPTCDEELVLFWIRQMLQEWEQELEARAEQEKRQKQGKLRTAEFHQTYQYLRPLMKRLKKKNLDSDLLVHVGRIVSNCKEREYVKANDSYYEMAIGNAAWPIGVTMVGIHERSAREKIHSNKTAHVLNDEVQRKYIQSMKRLMTFCQEKYPTDPSKCVR